MDQVGVLCVYIQFFVMVDLVWDVFWLLQDLMMVDDNVVLLLVLREGWNCNIVVFFSYVVYVKCGVLFLFYFDNCEFGCSFVVLVQWLVFVLWVVMVGVQLLCQVFVVFNICIVVYLGIDVVVVQFGFDLVYFFS